MSVSVFGIRHHGPGSARNLLDALDAADPDVILVEGPPDAQQQLPLAASEMMAPPVALLVYRPEMPSRCAAFPFAEFSPEWQAIRYGLARSIPVRFMDLPMDRAFALEPDEPDPGLGGGGSAAPDTAAGPNAPPPVTSDPLRWMAEAAGYTDSERWWESFVESRSARADIFPAILEMITAVRAEVESAAEPAGASQMLASKREALMRQTIRAAQREGRQNIAVVCGAWHAPALATMPSAKHDSELLRDMPKVKTVATWIPWTHDRLTWWSGYGAGIDSPEYYLALWRHPAETAVWWMGSAAALLRAEDLPVSPASAIDAVRLAAVLATLHGRTVPGLPELIDAGRAALCNGDDILLRLVHRKLVVGSMMGSLPPGAPTVPLQADLEAEQRRLRLKPEASERSLDLDLRKPRNLSVSHLLHRLTLLGIPWGVAGMASGTGTFREVWQLCWAPEFAVRVIESGVWGNTVATAATGFAVHKARTAVDLAEAAALVGTALLADLPEAMTDVLNGLQNLAGTTGDTGALMDALPALARAARYGTVRSSETQSVERMVRGLLTRICVGLTAACSALAAEAAEQMFERINQTHASLLTLANSELMAEWRAALEETGATERIPGIISGRCCRLLYDDGTLAPDAVEHRMRLAISTAVPASDAAGWLEGFLRGGGLALLHHRSLWNILDSWVCALSETAFMELLPVVRRTFSTFLAAELRQMGERAKEEPSIGPPATAAAGIDLERAALVLPTLALLMGVAAPSDTARHREEETG